ncbi:MAG: GNAT family N-acetyltransferase [Nitrososphaerota archaeon]|nr:GNAT family N-acetyltransferase [Candidatus Bathyarchaeota archaeon]MDW8049245.1 GNAT family N-acetyltransferase [Nitrososphaerota archaeon]
MEIIVKEGRIENLSSIYEIEVECFGEEAFPRAMIEYAVRSSGNSKTYIAFFGDKPVGFIIGRIYRDRDKPVGVIYTLDVKADFRRRGIGTRLLHTLENAFLKDGAELCRLEVSIKNIEALNLYMKFGYKKIRVLHNYYGRGHDGILLEKRLKQE